MWQAVAMTFVLVLVAGLGLARQSLNGSGSGVVEPAASSTTTSGGSTAPQQAGPMTFDYRDPSQRDGSIDGPVFNAHINGPFLPDERDFVIVKGEAGEFSKNAIIAYAQPTVVRIIVHNSASPTLGPKGDLKDIRVKVTLPSVDALEQTITAQLSASNAPTVTAAATVSGDDSRGCPFRLRYLEGSATVSDGTSDISAAASYLLFTEGEQVRGGLTGGDWLTVQFTVQGSNACG